MASDQEQGVASASPPQPGTGVGATPSGRTAPNGPYAGNTIRRARKDYACDEMVSWAPFARCNKPINAGDFYVEGEASRRALAAIAKAEGRDQ